MGSRPCVLVAEKGRARKLFGNALPLAGPGSWISPFLPFGASYFATGVTSLWEYAPALTQNGS